MSTNGNSSNNHNLHLASPEEHSGFLISKHQQEVQQRGVAVDFMSATINVTNS
jgi:hypothetical protein